MTKLNLKSLPVVDRDILDLEALQAERAMANKRVSQAVKRRDELDEKIKPLLRQRAVEDLKRRGIKLGETAVIVSVQGWFDGEWEYKKAIVMDVIVEESFDTDDELDVQDFALTKLKISYEFAAVKKDGKPSKAYSGINPYRATIERIA